MTKVRPSVKRAGTLNEHLHFQLPILKFLRTTPSLHEATVRRSLYTHVLQLAKQSIGNPALG